AFLDWVGHIDTNGWPPRPILVSGVAVRAMPGVPGSASAADPVSRGKALFNGPGGCASCHSVEPGVMLVGPSLSGVAKTGAARIQDPQYHGRAHTAAEYLEESIRNPSVFIVPDGLYANPQHV